MIELNKNQLTDLLGSNQVNIIYFYTPLCGTCKLATKMLTVISNLVPDRNIFSCNINLVPDLAHKMMIKSVPCLLVIENGLVEKEVYAFHSVPHILNILEEYIKP